MKPMEIKDHGDVKINDSWKKQWGDDKDSSLKHKLFHIFPKLWPQIILKHQLHGFVEFKMARN
jgi:hypothetical protein